MDNERDWKKEPYNTWDTLAAMRLPPMTADKHDIDAIKTRLTELEQKVARILEILIASSQS